VTPKHREDNNACKWAKWTLPKPPNSNKRSM